MFAQAPGRPFANYEYGSGRRASWPLRLTNDGTTVTVMHDDGIDCQYRLVGGNYVVQNVPYGDTLVKNGDCTWDKTRGDTGYTFHYPTGNAVSVAYWASPLGLRVTCNYDAGQKLQSLVEPADRRVTLSYNTDGKVQFIQDWGDQRHVVMTYVGSDMTGLWGPAGSVTTFHYDGNHYLTAISDPELYLTTITYDYAGRVLTCSVAGNLGRYTYVTSGSDLRTGYVRLHGHSQGRGAAATEVGQHLAAGAEGGGQRAIAVVTR
jgi:YD repeat-containing protein